MVEDHLKNMIDVCAIITNNIQIMAVLDCRKIYGLLIYFWFDLDMNILPMKFKSFYLFHEKCIYFFIFREHIL